LPKLKSTWAKVGPFTRTLRDAQSPQPDTVSMQSGPFAGAM
jgi:hypothetical protein